MHMPSDKPSASVTAVEHRDNAEYLASTHCLTIIRGHFYPSNARTMLRGAEVHTWAIRSYF